MRALEKDPARRFKDADAFIHALDAAEREPDAPQGGGTAAFAPLPPSDIAEAKAPPGAAGAPPPSAPRRRRRRWIFVAAAVVLGVLAGLALSRDSSVEVRDVTGEQLSAAVSILQAEGFEVGEILRVERPRPRDFVLEQDPSGSTALDCSFLSFFCSKPTVTLTVSAGPGRAEVPRLRGLALEQAETLLEEEGFGSEVTTQPSDQFEEGVVISSDPSAGTMLTRGRAVTLVVSSGPAQIRVPDVTGQSEGDAIDELAGAGLLASATEQESDQPEGEVIGQSPDAGSKVERGSTVTIFVSGGVGTVAVPGLVGLTRAQAVGALHDAGLSANVREVTVSDPLDEDRVVRQSPTGGTRVRRGRLVTVEVGVFEEPPTPPTPPSSP
jgi:serine/threonine-protein kinase